MKKALLLICLIFLAGCASRRGQEASFSGEGEDLQAMLAQKDARIADLENQVQELMNKYSDLQDDYDVLEDASASSEPILDGFLCEATIDNMKYSSAASAIAILEGWFALQPQVQEIQGTYSTVFWTGVNSRIHTIRYIKADDGLSETASFLIFFEEENWQEGLLSMSDQCWLDYPER